MIYILETGGSFYNLQTWVKDGQDYCGKASRNKKRQKTEGRRSDCQIKRNVSGSKQN